MIEGISSLTNAGYLLVAGITIGVVLVLAVIFTNSTMLMRKMLRQIRGDNENVPAKGSKPIGVSRLLEGEQSGLSRYESRREAHVVAEGRLREVTDLKGRPAAVWIVIGNIVGLTDGKLGTARIDSPTPGTDEILKGIGRNGVIRLEGIAHSTPGQISALHMTRVLRINDHGVRRG